MKGKSGEIMRRDCSVSETTSRPRTIYDQWFDCNSYKKDPSEGLVVAKVIYSFFIVNGKSREIPLFVVFLQKLKEYPFNGVGVGRVMV